MTRRITDPEVQLLAAISGTLEADYASQDDEWEGSPFAWIRRRPSRQVGSIGEKLVAGWCAAKDLDVTRAPDSECDRLIEGYRTEIKFSTLWRNGSYRFQQLRDQNYEFVVCLGLSPFDARAWVLPKTVVMEQWNRGEGLESQHGGASGTDTAWLHVRPHAVPEWLEPYGGTLSEAFDVLTGLVGR